MFTNTVPGAPQCGAAPLEWIQGHDHEWELRDGGRAYARLAPGARAWAATAAEGAWTVQQVGFHRPRIVVRPMGALAEVAHFQHDWHGHGTLCIASGPCYELDRTGPGGLVVRTSDGTSIARIAWSPRQDARAARVHLDALDATGRFGLLLLLVGAYLLISDLHDPSRPLTVGARPGPTVRSWFA
ncbi:MAG: hypothetical protein Q8P41_13865 [Pseudomonadota bacterium]|nr:hypothetical protein [Pseudomonadota bacterium]